MKNKLATAAALTLAVPVLWACQTDGQGVSTGGSGSTGSAMAQPSATPSGTTGASTAGTGSSGTSTGATPSSTMSPGTPSTSGIPSLVNVTLSNVLNDLAIKLNIDRANVPINIQLPIQLAANVCGVSVNVLAVSTGGQANCDAKTAPQELAQVVQQQMAAGGSVGGGAQGGSTAAAGGSTPTAGSSSGGATGTGATSSGANQ